MDAQATVPHHSGAKEIYFIVKVTPDALDALASTAPRRDGMCIHDASGANGNFAFPRRVCDPEHRTRDASTSSTEQAGYPLSCKYSVSGWLTLPLRPPFRTCVFVAPAHSPPSRTRTRPRPLPVSLPFPPTSRSPALALDSTMVRAPRQTDALGADYATRAGRERGMLRMVLTDGLGEYCIPRIHVCR